MFCKNNCESKRGRCGLYYEIRLHNTITNKDELIKKCAFLHMADSFMRLETSLLRIQSSIETSAHEEANADHKLSNIVATGFLGMMHAFNEDHEKFEKTLKLISTATQPKLEK